MMRVLVTRPLGFIGTHCPRSLLAEDRSIRPCQATQMTGAVVEVV
jgi:hypothetical protein